MPLIQSKEELDALKEQTFEKIKVRFKEHQVDTNQQQIDMYHILVCSGTGCVSSKSRIILAKLDSEIKKRKLQDQVKVFKTGCFGFCQLGPIIVIHPERTFYGNVEIADVDAILDLHIEQRQTVEKLLYKSPVTGKIQKTIDELDFFNHQMRIALRNCGVIDPESIDEYIALDGYSELAEILSEKRRPQDIIDQVKRSGLRGRGGGGFPTGLKWEFAAGYKDEQKYVLCNADEGDPGAFMDRSILEGDPHSIIEAMMIAGYCIGANQGYVYVRAEYPIAVERLEIAISQAKEAGLLGENILGSGFAFQLEIRLGAGAFVCGEETALIQSVMGMRGEPKARPPFPAEAGLWGKPTLNNNVETYANIPIILRKGADWYASIGTDDSKGTKVFALAGQINNTGLIEVPMGTTLRTVIFDIGMGIQGDKDFKAVQTGGPSGGCIPAALLDTKIDYKSLTDIGSMMGSGGLIVMDDSDCMVDIVRFYLEFAQDESCGKCVPCRIGTKRLLEIMERITQGQGKEEDVLLLRELSEDIKDASLCGLGQTAPNPILSALKYFPEEFEAHIRDKRCRACVCSALTQVIITDTCIACGICAKICPVDAISGERKNPPYIISQDVCIKCGACIPKCPVDAIIK